ncbi:MAG: MFS transporter, partial [archaeon]|nr:MFS transporter [archaeon]
MEQIVESSINREEKRDFLSVWPILLVTCIRFMTISSLVVNWPAITLIIWPLDPIQNHFIEMGLLVTLRTWFTAFSGILIGELADRFSRKKLHFFCTILLGVSYGMIGFFPTGGEYYSYFYFAICQCFAGFAMGGFAPIELSYINDKIDQNQRSQFFGMKAALGQMFMMSGMIISAFLIEFNIWKLWFWLIGGSMTISSFVILMKISEPQRASF